jgi:FkbM family methyltransferase
MSGSLIRFATELPFNLNPSFTKWLAKSGGLQEQFILIDVGVLGGENPRWHFLGDHLVVHGFDASKEAVDELLRDNAAFSNKTFHWFAIGNEDGDRKFYFNPTNPSSSSLSKFSGTQTRVVPIRRLDTLLKEQVIPKADFLKVDVEGHERELFLGASDLLSAGLLGVDVETSFVTDAAYPQAGFDLVRGLLTKHGLMISDLNFNRIRNETYQKARKQRRLPELPLEGAGKPATFNVLFCRNVAAEGSIYYEKLPPPLRVDQILKLMAIYELYGLNDIAVDIAITFSHELGRRLDVERAVDLLCENDSGAVREYLLEVRGLKSSLVAARRRVDALHLELSKRSNSQEKLGIRAVAGLEIIKAELNSVLVTGHEPPQPEQYTYESHAQTDSVIPEDPKAITRDHGAAILRISPRQSDGPSVLHVRILFNCHCSEPNNSVRITVFQDNSERPIAVLTEDLIPGELTLVDQDFIVSVMNTSRPPILEFRVGLAHPGGSLSFNHVPQPAFVSAVRMRWLSTEEALGTVAD